MTRGFGLDTMNLERNQIKQKEDMNTHLKLLIFNNLKLKRNLTKLINEWKPSNSKLTNGPLVKAIVKGQMVRNAWARLYVCITCTYIACF